ncbi:major facilitator superfamily domain-containing protein [Rhodocollybia butyracea]|uniref:Major facilitator superfamily domain-containing protein n=1 Tax=Rhodocollybia butyracea TaxID=206335 RepID=A0A9P5UEQ0_9AGAR|nr:major facilitator superfamily domain-containing protein [Rhodocollybia butyracea]
MATPLPKLQLFLTLLIQLSEPVMAVVIYPFITRAIRRTGITKGDEQKTGYWAGIIESLFFVSETLSVYHWGHASDFYGRRPILLIGPLGLTLAVLGFGLSQSFWGMAVSRAAMGVFNGNIGVSKTVMAESTDESNRADAFALMPIALVLGTTVGHSRPAIGGLLADPAARWPYIFGKLAFFKEFPWFLSCSAAGLISFAAFVLSYWGLKETLPSKAKQKRIEAAPLLDDSETFPSYGSVQNSEPTPEPLSSPEATPSSVQSLLGDSRLRTTLTSLGFLAFTHMAYESLLPLVYTTSIPVGGLGLSPYQVGVILGIFGLFNGFWNWLVLTKVLKKLGPRKTLTLFYAFFLLHFALLWILRDAAFNAGRITPHIWALFVFQLFVSAVIPTAFNANFLLIVKNAPPNALGSVNGLAQIISSGTRGVAPVFASSLFSYSLESRFAGGHLVEIVLCGVTIVGICCISRLPSTSS